MSTTVFENLRVAGETVMFCADSATLAVARTSAVIRAREKNCDIDADGRVVVVTDIETPQAVVTAEVC